MIDVRVKWLSLDTVEVAASVIEPIRVVPDSHPGGVPSAKFFREAAERNGFILHGVGQSDRPPGEARGVARIKRVSLVATVSAFAPGAGEVVATAEFRDVELEMIAFLLAA